MNDEDYNRGFADGLRWVSDALKKSALKVAETQYGDFESKNGGPIVIVRAITKMGQAHFAKQLIEVAKAIDEAIEQSK